MTARKPLVPPELRELVTLVSQLMAPLPLPAGEYMWRTADWDTRRDAADRRISVAAATLLGLEVTLEAADAHPEFYLDILVDCCRRDSERIRAELARPLGYEPRSVTPERVSGGESPEVVSLAKQATEPSGNHPVPEGEQMEAEDEPPPADYDPGPECDDQGGMSEYAHWYPEAGE